MEKVKRAYKHSKEYLEKKGIVEKVHKPTEMELQIQKGVLSKGYYDNQVTFTNMMLNELQRCRNQVDALRRYLKATPEWVEEVKILEDRKTIPHDEKNTTQENKQPQEIRRNKEEGNESGEER